MPNGSEHLTSRTDAAEQSAQQNQHARKLQELKNDLVDNADALLSTENINTITNAIRTGQWLNRNTVGAAVGFLFNRNTSLFNLYEIYSTIKADFDQNNLFHTKDAKSRKPLLAELLTDEKGWGKIIAYIQDGRITPILQAAADNLDLIKRIYKIDVSEKNAQTAEERQELHQLATDLQKSSKKVVAAICALIKLKGLNANQACAIADAIQQQNKNIAIEMGIRLIFDLVKADGDQDILNPLIELTTDNDNKENIEAILHFVLNPKNDSSLSVFGGRAISTQNITQLRVGFNALLPTLIQLVREDKITANDVNNLRKIATENNLSDGATITELSQHKSMRLVFEIVAIVTRSEGGDINPLIQVLDDQTLKAPIKSAVKVFVQQFFIDQKDLLKLAKIDHLSTDQLDALFDELYDWFSSSLQKIDHERLLAIIKPILVKEKDEHGDDITLDVSLLLSYISDHSEVVKTALPLLGHQDIKSTLIRITREMLEVNPEFLQKLGLTQVNTAHVIEQLPQLYDDTLVIAKESDLKDLFATIANLTDPSKEDFLDNIVKLSHLILDGHNNKSQAFQDATQRIIKFALDRYFFKRVEYLEKAGLAGSQPKQLNNLYKALYPMVIELMQELSLDQKQELFAIVKPLISASIANSDNPESEPPGIDITKFIEILVNNPTILDKTKPLLNNTAVRQAIVCIIKNKVLSKQTLLDKLMLDQAQANQLVDNALPGVMDAVSNLDTSDIVRLLQHLSPLFASESSEPAANLDIIEILNWFNDHPEIVDELKSALRNNSPIFQSIVRNLLNNQTLLDKMMLNQAQANQLVDNALPGLITAFSNLPSSDIVGLLQYLSPFFASESSEPAANLDVAEILNWLRTHPEILSELRTVIQNNDAIFQSIVTNALQKYAQDYPVLKNLLGCEAALISILKNDTLTEDLFELADAAIKKENAKVFRKGLKLLFGHSPNNTAAAWSIVGSFLKNSLFGSSSVGSHTSSTNTTEPAATTAEQTTRQQPAKTRSTLEKVAMGFGITALLLTPLAVTAWLTTTGIISIPVILGALGLASIAIPPVAPFAIAIALTALVGLLAVVAIAATIAHFSKGKTAEPFVTQDNVVTEAVSANDDPMATDDPRAVVLSDELDDSVEDSQSLSDGNDRDQATVDNSTPAATPTSPVSISPAAATATNPPAAADNQVMQFSDGSKHNATGEKNGASSTLTASISHSPAA